MRAKKLGTLWPTLLVVWALSLALVGAQTPANTTQYTNSTGNATLANDNITSIDTSTNTTGNASDADRVLYDLYLSLAGAWREAVMRMGLNVSGVDVLIDRAEAAAAAGNYSEAVRLLRLAVKSAYLTLKAYNYTSKVEIEIEQSVSVSAKSYNSSMSNVNATHVSNRVLVKIEQELKLINGTATKAEVEVTVSRALNATIMTLTILEEVRNLLSELNVSATAIQQIDRAIAMLHNTTAQLKKVEIEIEQNGTKVEIEIKGGKIEVEIEREHDDEEKSEERAGEEHGAPDSREIDDEGHDEEKEKSRRGGEDEHEERPERSGGEGAADEGTERGRGEGRGRGGGEDRRDDEEEHEDEDDEHDDE